MCGRDDLGRDEILELATARRAIAGERETLQEGRWAIELDHDIHGTGAWSARVYRQGTGLYDGLRIVSPVSERDNPAWRGYPDRESALADARELIALID